MWMAAHIQKQLIDLKLEEYSFSIATQMREWISGAFMGDRFRIVTLFPFLSFNSILFGRLTIACSACALSVYVCVSVY